MSYREKLIELLLKKYALIASKDIDAANIFLDDFLFEKMESTPFDTLVYVYKQVLLRHFISISYNYDNAANLLSMNRSTLAEMRRHDGNLNEFKPTNENYTVMLD